MFVSHALVLAQTLLIAQAAVGLLLLSDGKRAPEKLHYTYGALALSNTMVEAAAARSRGRFNPFSHRIMRS